MKSIKEFKRLEAGIKPDRRSVDVRYREKMNRINTVKSFARSCIISSFNNRNELIDNLRLSLKNLAVDNATITLIMTAVETNSPLFNANCEGFACMKM